LPLIIYAKIFKTDVIVFFCNVMVLMSHLPIILSIKVILSILTTSLSEMKEKNMPKLFTYNYINIIFFCANKIVWRDKKFLSFFVG
jgi:hypothetical protein